MKHTYTNTQLQSAALSQLRPLAEAGPVPEGCVRHYTYKQDGEWTTATKHRAMQDTHYIDTRLSESEPLVTKPISLPLAESMSLRDWFAGMALQAMNFADAIQQAVEEGVKPSQAGGYIAEACYKMADAMLAAREVKP